MTNPISDPIPLSNWTGSAIAIVVMAATLCGIVHGYSYYWVFGLNFFELSARDDFIMAALRSPISLIVVLAIWVMLYPQAMSPRVQKLQMISYYLLLPTVIVAALGIAQGRMVKTGLGKVFGQPQCKITLSVSETKTEDIFGVTPLGTSGQFLIVWIYQQKEVRIINGQTVKALSCTVGD